ncbi:MAG: FapA family protein [bacterium]
MSAPKLIIKEDGIYVENPQSESEFIANLRKTLNEMGIASFNEADFIKCSNTANNHPILISESLPSRYDATVYFFPYLENPRTIIATILPPRLGKELTKEDVLLKLEELGFAGVSPNLSSIDTALARQKTEKYTYSFSVGTRTAPQIDVVSEPGDMEATVTVKSDEEKKPFYEEDILFALRKAGVVKGYQRKIILDIIQKQEFDVARVVARGVSPVDGDDGEILYHFDAENETCGPQMDETGKVDHHQLGIYNAIEEGASLCEVIPSTEGIPGYDVFGNETAAQPGKEVDLPEGRNTKPHPDKPNVLITSCAGIPKLSNGKVIVNPVLNIQGDVGTSTGDVEFSGPVNISGTIDDGFKVAAKGDVIVYDSCNSVKIESEGNVILKHGIRSDDCAFIKAGGDVYALFLEGVTVEAGGNVIVQEYIYHSNITAGKAVEVVGKKGYISGGKIIAHRPVLGKRLGGPAAPKTEIELISSKHKEAKLNEADKIKLVRLKDHLNETNRKLETARNLDNEILDKLQKEKKEILRNIHSMKPSYAEPGFNSSLFVAILGTVHPNVIITIDGVKLNMKNEFIDVKFVLRDDKIEMEGLEPQDFQEFITGK